MAAGTVTCCMIVKDEEELLGSLLEHIKPWFDEVIVVDTGSTDDTIKIAEKAGVEVLTAVMDYGFAAARNVGIVVVETEWFFVLDADEWPTTELLQWIKSFVRTPSSHHYESGILWRENKVGEGPSQLEKHARLFKAHLRYEGKVHEAIPRKWDEILLPESALLLHHKSWERQHAQDELYERMLNEGD